MSVRLRLSRRGTKKSPFYHLVIADQRSPRDGSFIEQVGTYDPRVSPPVRWSFANERIQRTGSRWAQPSELRPCPIFFVMAARTESEVGNAGWIDHFV